MAASAQNLQPPPEPEAKINPLFQIQNKTLPHH